MKSMVHEDELIFEPEEARLVFEHTGDGVVLVNKEGIITYINPACEELFGIKKADICGRGFRSVFMCEKKNKDFNHLAERSLDRHKDTEKTAVEYYTGDGNKLNIIVDFSLIGKYEGGGGHNGLMLMVEDESFSHNVKRQDKDSARTFSGLIVVVTLYLAFWSLSEFTLKLDLGTEKYTYIIEGICFLLFLYILIFTSFSLREVGLVPNFSRIKKNISETVMVGVLAASLLVIARGAGIFIGIEGKDYFIGGSFAGFSNYLLTCLLQEFLARGVIQTSVKVLLKVKYQKQLSVIIASLLFSLMHLPFGFYFMLGACALSIVLGIIYERQHDIWGCFVLHWCCGYLAMSLFF